MPSELEIAPVTVEEFERLLPLIAAYQRFYQVEEIDEERNRTFFRRFLSPSEDGLLLGARPTDAWSATPASTGTSARWRRASAC